MMLFLLSLLAVMRLAPSMPSAAFDDAWALALNDVTARHLVFGRDVLFTFGPWSAVYTGQYHPRIDRLMLAGGLLVAAAFASGLAAISRGGRIVVSLLAPLLVASVDQHDPVFMVLPLLLLSVSVGLSQPAGRKAAVAASPMGMAALALLASTDALLSLVKLSFGTEALPIGALSVLALALRRRTGLAILVVLVYAISLPGYWVVSGQALSDLPGYIGSVPEILSGYTEGAAWDGAAGDIVVYLLGAALLPMLFWGDRSRLAADGRIILGIGLLATLFVSFKAGFIRHDDHALIAVGTLALLPLVLSHAYRASSLATALAASVAVLAYVSQHHAGQVWPSPTRTALRLADAARGAWLRVADPERLGRLYASDLASYRAAVPLPSVRGPSDIYSSGQTFLIANNLDYSPRPALQSFTAFSDPIIRADLEHLEGETGHAPVENVFFRLEHPDFRLPTTEDGPSWPALFDEFHVTGFDVRTDTALFQRWHAPAPTPIGPSLLHEENATIGATVSVPISPTGLLWAKLDPHLTLLGRLASVLFRPPILQVTIDYASGPPERDRLVSALGRAGFLFGPRVSDTAEMMLLLLPERRAPEYRPTSIRVTGAPGTSWAWRQRFDLELKAIALPTQPELRPGLVVTPTPAARTIVRLPSDDRCHIDIVDDRYRPSGEVPITGLIRISGWLVPSEGSRSAPESMMLRFTDPTGPQFEVPAVPRRRPDEPGHSGADAARRSDFDEIVDTSPLHGDFRLTIETVADGIQRSCRPERNTAEKRKDHDLRLIK